jgi:hypothetical protein
MILARDKAHDKLAVTDKNHSVPSFQREYRDDAGYRSPKFNRLRRGFGLEAFLKFK